MSVRSEDLLPNEYFEIGDKYFSRAFNNLVVLVFYCRLQLIQHSLTNGLFPPFPRIPTNLGINILHNNLEKLQLASAKIL